MCIESRGAPADLANSRQIRVTRCKFAAFFEGVSGVVGAESVERKRICPSNDLELDITPRAPPQWSERSVLPSVRKILVGQAHNHAVGNFVSVAAFLLRIVESFGECHTNDGI